MSELIRREDVQREIQTSFDGGAFRWQDGQDLMDRINALPTASPWHRVEEELPGPNIQCLVRDDDNNCAVGYYRQDARAWDSPFFGWLERDDEYYEDGDLCRIGKVVAWMPIEPPKEDA